MSLKFTYHRIVKIVQSYFLRGNHVSTYIYACSRYGLLYPHLAQCFRIFRHIFFYLRNTVPYCHIDDWIELHWLLSKWTLTLDMIHRWKYFIKFQRCATFHHTTFHLKTLFRSSQTSNITLTPALNQTITLTLNTSLKAQSAVAVTCIKIKGGEMKCREVSCPVPNFKCQRNSPSCLLSKWITENHAFMATVSCCCRHLISQMQLLWNSGIFPRNYAESSKRQWGAGFTSWEEIPRSSYSLKTIDYSSKIMFNVYT